MTGLLIFMLAVFLATFLAGAVHAMLLNSRRH